MAESVMPFTLSVEAVTSLEVVRLPFMISLKLAIDSLVCFIISPSSSERFENSGLSVSVRFPDDISSSFPFTTSRTFTIRLTMIMDKIIMITISRILSTIIISVLVLKALLIFSVLALASILALISSV